MSKDYESLINSARQARDRSYSPYSRFALGAALRVRSGEVFLGANIEEISFGLTLCVERCALASAITGGHRDIETLVLVNDSNEPPIPCGACWQALGEFSPDLLMVCATVGGNRKVESLINLLPAPSRGILEHAGK